MDSCGADIVGRRDLVVLGVLVGAGLRRAELTGLRWENIKTQPVRDKVRTVLDVHGKGAKDRGVPISDELADILNRWAAWTGYVETVFGTRSSSRAQRIP
jgi:integrase